MLKTILILVAFCSFHFNHSISSKQAAQKTNQKFFIKYFNTSIKENINSVKMLDSKKGYAIGKTLFMFDGNKWITSDKLNDLDRLSDFHIKSKEEIYLVDRIFPLNISKLYLLNNQKLTEISHPLGNEIVSIAHYGNDVMWLGGDRELARCQNGKWQFIKFPPTLFAVIQIIPIDAKRFWIRSTEGELFFFNGIYWKQYLIDQKVKSIIQLSPDSLLIQCSEEILLLNKEKFSLINSDKIIRKFTRIEGKNVNNIYGIGPNGLFCYYNGKNWVEVPIDLHDDLNSISLTNEKEGFVACNSGIIFKFSGDRLEENQISRYGFDGIMPIQYARNLDGEYGVGIEDINGDGLQEIYTVDAYNPNRLYINTLKKENSDQYLFTEKAIEMKATGINEEDILHKFLPKLQLGVCIADFDNDGDSDIYLTSLIGENKFLLNTGKGNFRDVSYQSGRAQGKTERTNSAITGDVNNDGWLDIFLVNEYSTNRLFLNNKNGYFIEASEESGLLSSGGSSGASFADFDNDGKLDLIVCNWGRENDLYKNVSSGEKVLYKKMYLPNQNTDKNNKKSNSALFFDYNNDSKLDLFITYRGSTNRLYQNLGNFSFLDVTENVLGFDTLLSYSATAADFDNDGYQDLFVSNVGKTKLYKNISGKKFYDVTLQYGAENSGYCTGTASGDIDNDGDIDIYSTCFVNGTSKLFVNKRDGSNYITAKINGTATNRDAIGVTVSLYNQKTDSLFGYREISGGSGYSSISSKHIHFGAKPGQKYKLVIYFPTSKKTKVIEEITAGSILNVNEEEGWDKFSTNNLKMAGRVILDPETHTEILKFSFVLLIISLSYYRGKKLYSWRTKFNFYSHFSLIIVYASLTWLFLYKSLFLSAIFPLGTIILGIVLLHLIFERFILVKRIKLEREQTREKIARDLHDDFASTISTGLIYADALNRGLKNENPKEKALAQNIFNLLSEASESVTDLVWSVSPSYDTLEDLLVHLRYFIVNSCQNNKLEYDISIGDYDKSITLSEEYRKNIFLIFKEALNNALKHSAATKITFTAKQLDKNLEISLHDDGNGFSGSGNQSASGHGNGLDNIKKRANEINSEIEIKSSVGKGCEIKLSVKITPKGY